MRRPSLKKTNSSDLDYNFNQLATSFQSLSDFAGAKTVSATLAVGDNSIVPTVANPQGRLLLFQSAAANLFDKGLVNGKWVINSSAICSIRLAFF